MMKAGREKGRCNKERKVDVLSRLKVLIFNCQDLFALMVEICQLL